MPVCGHVMTALLCAAQTGGLMNTGELCESVHFDESFSHTACHLSLPVAVLSAPLSTQRRHLTVNGSDVRTTGMKAPRRHKLPHHACIIAPPPVLPFVLLQRAYMDN